MQAMRTDWAKLAGQLGHWGLHDMTAWLLEAAGPLRMMGAQVLYFGQPFLSYEWVGTLAGLLEDDDEAQAFAAYLRKERTS